MLQIFNTILPQLQSLLNIVISKYVNTGDRLLDNSLIAILSTLLGIAIIYLPILYKLISAHVYKIDQKSNFDPNKTDISHLTHEMILKYKYKLQIKEYCGSSRQSDYLYSDLLEEWILRKYGNICGISEAINMYILPANKCLGIEYDMSFKNIKMPIYRYFNGVYAEYIIYYQGCIYCNDLKVLEKFVFQFFEKTTVVDNNKYIYEVNEKGAVIKKGKINMKKSFDKLHFDKKNNIIDMLDKFQSNTMYPEELSLDNKIGCLLYGPPGTAKTATCIATAIYLNRHILILSSLLSLPRDQILDIIELHKKTHVIILDEFDHILSRKAEKIDYKAILQEAKTPAELSKAKALANECKISDDEFILKLLDGITDGAGRVVFATTNSVEKINPKFLRPGRFDIVVELSYCSFNMFKNICKSIYKNEELYIEHVDYINDVLQNNITPLVLINAMIRTSTFIDMLNLLKSGEIEAFKHKNKVKNMSTQTELIQTELTQTMTDSLIY